MALQALVMGFGGTGAHILTYLKEITVLKYGYNPESVRFLLFDTIADWRPGSTVKILGGSAEETLAQGSEEGTSLDPIKEYFFLTDHDPNLQKYVFEYLSQAGNLDEHPQYKDWLHATWLDLNVPKKALNISEGAAQQRQIGRFAMFQNAERIIQQMQAEIRKLQQHAENSAINIWLVGSSAGGTGAGCLLDAAFISRLAAQNSPVNITGVIVLPEIYGDKDGIILGRAFSLFRELERFQDIGGKRDDRYVYKGEQITSRVLYDARERHTATVKSKLFDNLFYIGRECRSDAARNSFFTSAANSIDPYLDMTSGPPLLEASLNDAGAAASFGAARLYMPMETYKELFAWEQVYAWLQGATAPILQNRTATDLHHGSEQDRVDNAIATVESLLDLFKNLLDLRGKTDSEIAAFADNLQAKNLIQVWYGFAGAALAGLNMTPAEAEDIKLTYIDPFISYVESDPLVVGPGERNVITYKEHKRTKAPKESPKESRDRFLKELDRVFTRYKNPEGAKHTFERGRKLVFEKLTGLLIDKVDDHIANELQQNVKFATDPQNPEAGTAMTRLFHELKVILSDNGPFAEIDQIIGSFINALKGSEESLQQQAARSQAELREWKKTGFMGGGAVDGFQESARDDAGRYIQAYQKYRLLQDMQKLVRTVRDRFNKWTANIRIYFEELVMDPSSSNLRKVNDQLKRLNGRLYRLSSNRSALFSCDQSDPENPDISMQGYRDQLQAECTVRDGASLAALLLANTQWVLEKDNQGAPHLKLALQFEGVKEITTSEKVAHLHQQLHAYFRKHIDRQLSDRDIFDYLQYAQQAPRNVNAKQVSDLLNKAAGVLINANVPESCLLIYKDPVDINKRNLADAILKNVDDALGNISVTDSPHSDPYSITLMKIKKPNLTDINNVIECEDDYMHWQTADTNGDEKHDINVKRSQVFHPFRPELEAWHIERQIVYKEGKSKIRGADQIPPRVIRLLENPAKMQAFVQCIATQAIENVDRSWIWHNYSQDQDVVLTDGENDPTADLIRAAVIFVLREQEGKTGGLIRITLQDAKQSAIEAAKRQEMTLENAMSGFLNAELDAYLSKAVPDDPDGSLKTSLAKIFKFYGHPTTRPQLRNRMG